MRPYNTRAFSILSVEDAERITGLASAEIRALPSVQVLTRVFADGRSERALRVPTELLTATAAD